MNDKKSSENNKKVGTKRLGDSEKKEEENLPELRKASELTIKRPDSALEKEEEDKIINAVEKGGVVTDEGKCFIDKKQLSKVLVTDKKGAAKVYNDAQAKDKYEDGKNSYLSVAETKKNIEERLEEPRTTLEHEKLEYSDKVLTEFRSAPELVKERHIEADRIKKERPLLTKEKVKKENITECELSGEKFENDARGHHVERVEDNPRKARNLDNIVVIKEDIHKDIHENGAESPEKLKEYIKKNNYNMPDNLK
ncbi:hypothetical protein [Clostridium butyricum]|uniref:hypothetical protein n=1 Tax=Clostridium butyricum TaxID=1492 RepID=UPI00374EED65